MQKYMPIAQGRKRRSLSRTLTKKKLDVYQRGGNSLGQGERTGQVARAIPSNPCLRDTPHGPILIPSEKGTRDVTRPDRVGGSLGDFALQISTLIIRPAFASAILLRNEEKPLNHTQHSKKAPTKPFLRFFDRVLSASDFFRREFVVFLREASRFVKTSSYLIRPAYLAARHCESVGISHPGSGGRRLQNSAAIGT